MFILEKKALAILKIANAFSSEIIKYNEELANRNPIQARKDSVAWRPPVQEGTPAEGDNGTGITRDREL
jgi:hypothetical protein